MHCIEVDGSGNAPSNALRQWVSAHDLAFLGKTWDPAWLQMRVRTRIWEHVAYGDLWFRMREGFRSETGPEPQEEEAEPDFSLNDIELGREALSLTTRLDGFEEMEAPDEDDDDLCEGSW